jgi:hypothetical protein
MGIYLLKRTDMIQEGGELCRNRKGAQSATKAQHIVVQSAKERKGLRKRRRLVRTYRRKHGVNQDDYP